MEINERTQKFLDAFEDAIEDNKPYDDNERKAVAAEIQSREELRASLPALLEKAQDYNTRTQDCDKNIKMWQESKKLWQSRAKAFLETLGTILENLKIDSFKPDDIKLATSSRTSLEVDEEWLISQYAAAIQALQDQLPGYVKVSVSIDKNKLFAHVKGDSTMLISNPDKIHTKTSKSTTIK